jgi:hypothetical protein
MRWLRKVASGRPPPGRDPAESDAGASAGVAGGPVGRASACAHGSPAPRDVGLTVGAKDLMPAMGPIRFSVSKRDNECSSPCSRCKRQAGAGVSAWDFGGLSRSQGLLSDQALKLGSLHRDDCLRVPTLAERSRRVSIAAKGLPSRAAPGLPGRAPQVSPASVSVSRSSRFCISLNWRLRISISPPCAGDLSGSPCASRRANGANIAANPRSNISMLRRT